MKKQVLVTVDRAETRVAILEASGNPTPVKPRGRGGRRKADPAAGWRVAEVYLERRGKRSIVGNIYKGKVDNVLPGLEAAFVDIGLEKNGFLHVDEIVLPGVEAPKRGRGGREGRRIADLLKPGQEVVVQVVKDPLKTKGARLSMELAIAGRYMVYAPTGEGIGVSRRLDDKERERLRKEARQLGLGGGGAIIRTAAAGATRADFERELQYLFKLNEVLQDRVGTQPAPTLVFQEADLSVRVVRDIFSAHFERAVVDDVKQHHRLVSFFSRTAPELLERVELYDEDQEGAPLFERYGVQDAIEGMLERRVDLPSGGYLMIDYAEALTVIDVNTGSFIGRGKSARLEDTITKTNLEAAEEVVNQLRLRDIGGIIVIDFIDMARTRNRDAVLGTLRNALEEDRTKTYVVEISPLGLVEMTRQNVTDGVREVMTTPCPTCDGEGVIRSEETIAIDVERRLREIVKEAGEDRPEAYLLRLHPRVSEQFTQYGAHLLHQLEEETGRWFHFEGSDGLPLEHFSITFTGPREEVEARALPFRAGEEVLVHIVEPHMYSVDDAVAKIDGYIISVTGGGRFVGEKHLVRIDEAGRTSARATIIDLPETPGSEEGGDGDAAPGRRRGTRGGRRRKSGDERAAAASDATEAAADAVGTGDGARAAADASATPSAPAAEEEPAPRRRRARTSRAAQDAEAAEPAQPEAAGGPLRATETGAEPAAAEASEPVEPEPPKRTRRRRATASADAAEVQAEAEEADAGVDAEAEQRPRRRRARRRKADAETPPEAETSGAEVPGPESPARYGGRAAEDADVSAAAPDEPPLPDGAGAADAEDSKSDEDALPSGSRRRGRRGGRRRSRATADAAEASSDTSE